MAMIAAKNWTGGKCRKFVLNTHSACPFTYVELHATFYYVSAGQM